MTEQEARDGIVAQQLRLKSESAACSARSYTYSSSTYNRYRNRSAARSRVSASSIRSARAQNP